MADLVTGDTGSKLITTCKDNESGAVINLTGATVRLRWEDDVGVVTKVMTITSAAGGVAEYRFLAAEILSPAMTFEVEITDSAGFIITNTTLITLSVREQLG